MDNHSNPLVSIIMPAYQAANYIAESIQSVIDQTYPHWELLVVDDGSTDNTGEVVRTLAASDQRIKYIYQQNGRQGKARNNGLRHASGEYIAFLDADDLWIPGKLKIQVDLLLSNHADVTFSDSYCFTDKPEEKGTMFVVPGFYKGEKDFPHFLMTNRVPILTVVASRKAIEAVNGFSEEPEIQNAEDLNLWLKLLLAGNSFYAIEKPLTYYRLNPHSSTATDRHVIFPILHGFKKLAKLWPQYKPVISQFFLYRIDAYISQNNIGNWEMVNRLLALRNKITDKKVAIGYWKLMYSVFGKRVFRILFKSGLKPGSDKVAPNIDDIQF